MVGETVGHFRIVRRIGEGGMGHVYLADDLRLDRQVALKVLSHGSPSPEQIARFEREAKAAAALNHPNVLAIHDYGVHASMPYVVMELLEGQNLRQVLRAGPLRLETALECASALAAGLSAAHDKGIGHRDLKPENIFVTRDGRVKILDFGLATALGGAPVSPADQMTGAALTLPGVVMGTAGYMAPEQVMGQRVDARADIFAFGAVLFEMLTGRRAFEGSSAIEILHGILKSEPPFHLLSSSSMQGVPPGVIEIVRRCLQKNRDDRFQSAGELAAALKSARGPARALAPSPSAPTSRAGSVSEIQAPPELERVTNTLAVTVSPALSPDGRMVVYVSDGGQDETAPQIWLHQVGGAAMRLTSGLRECAGPSFSADHLRVLFTARGGATLNVYQLPTLGGVPQLLKRNAKGARISPDGRWLSYVSLEAPRRIRVAARDDENDRLIAPDLMDVSSAVWSPDSKHLLVRAHPGAVFERDYWVVSLDGRPPVNTGIVEKLKNQAYMLDQPPAWIGESFVFATGSRVGVMLWRQRFEPHSFELIGQPEPLTHGADWAVWPSAAANRLAFVSAHPDVNLWSIPLDPISGVATAPPRRITRGPGIMGYLSVTADGERVVYFSTRSGKPQLIVRDLRDGAERAVTTEPVSALKTHPAISPNGTQLAHGTLVPGPRALRPVVVVDLTNETSREVSEDSGGRPRQWIDERSLLIETFGSQLNSFAIIDTTNGSQRELLRGGTRSVSNPRVSPDGSRIAFDATPPGGSPAVVIAPLRHDAPTPESEWIAIEEGASHPFWSADGRLLYYLPTMPNDDLRSTVLARHINTSTGRPDGDAFTAVALKELFVPTAMPTPTPQMASDQILCVLSDLRGDVWIRSL